MYVLYNLIISICDGTTRSLGANLNNKWPTITTLLNNTVKQNSFIATHWQPWFTWKALRGKYLASHLNVLSMCREKCTSRKQIPIHEEPKDRSKYKSNKRYPGDRLYLQSSNCKACIILLSLRHFLLSTFLLILTLSYEKCD